MSKCNVLAGLALILSLAVAYVPAGSRGGSDRPGLLSLGPETQVSANEFIIEPVCDADETLHWDGANANGIGLTSGGTFQGAVRFTPTTACSVKAILYFQRGLSSNDWVFVLGEGNDTTPGPAIDSTAYTVVDTNRWYRVNLTQPVVTPAGTDFWTSVRVTHTAGRFPLGCDAGPMVRNRGGFISTGGGRWQQLADLTLDYNWNIRAVIARLPSPAHDVGVSAILAPGTSINPGTYQPKARVTNYGASAESNIPVTCWIDSGATRVYNQTVNLAGPLQPGTRAEVTFPNWTSGPSGNNYRVTMFTGLSGDLVPANDTLSQITAIATGLALVDHDTGYCKLTVSCFGAIGYDNPPADAGSGFCYPKTAGSALFYSSFLVGNDTMYVADRHFSRPANGPVNDDLKPVDSLMPVVPPQAGDEQFRASFDDRGHPSPKGVKVYQNSYMSAGSGYDDFVVLNWTIANEGAAALNGLYAGVWSDFDIGTTPTQNTATADTVRRLIYMRQSSTANPTAGMVILHPQSFRNLLSVDHARWVYPTDSCVRDAQKFRMLNGTIVQRNSNRPYDWSVLASIGPFDLEAGASQRFAIAFVGGADENAIRENADSAQRWFSQNVGLAEQPALSQGRRLTISPNPFRRGAYVAYTARSAGRLDLDVRDATGRVVERIRAEVPAGDGRYLWRPERLAQGVYFVTVRTPDSAVETKVLKLD